MLVPFYISSAEEQSSEERKGSLSPCTHRPRRGTGLGLGSACCCPPGSRSPPISHPCEVHAKQLLNHCAPRLLQLSGVINNTSYPRSLFAGEGIRAQNILPPPPPVRASHPRAEAASLMQMVLMEKVYNQGAKSESCVALISNYTLVFLEDHLHYHC